MSHAARCKYLQSHLVHVVSYDIGTFDVNQSNLVDAIGILQSSFISKKIEASSSKEEPGRNSKKTKDSYPYVRKGSSNIFLELVHAISFPYIICYKESIKSG